jgi:hypothetical protein
MDEKEKGSFGEFEEGDAGVRTTVVGGRPRKRSTATIRIPIGIERILYRAAVDPKFREQLHADRDSAIRSSGIRLLPSERMIIATVNDNALDSMIDRIHPEMHGKRRFMQSVAASFITLATGTAVLTCTEQACGGIEPDQDFLKSDIVETDTKFSEVMGDTADISYLDKVGGDVPTIEEKIDQMVDLGAEPDYPDDMKTAEQTGDSYIDINVEDMKVGGIMPDTEMEGYAAPQPQPKKKQ